MKITRHGVEIVEHNLNFYCLRRREWIEVDGEIFQLEYTVESPDVPPVSNHDIEIIAKNTKKQGNELEQLSQRRLFGNKGYHFLDVYCQK